MASGTDIGHAVENLRTIALNHPEYGEMAESAIRLLENGWAMERKADALQAALNRESARLRKD